MYVYRRTTAGPISQRPSKNEGMQNLQIPWNKNNTRRWLRPFVKETLKHLKHFYVNSVLSERNITMENKRRIYSSIVKNILRYSCEVCPTKNSTKKMLYTTEMDYWRKSAEKLKKERITNKRIKQVIGVIFWLNWWYKCQTAGRDWTCSENDRRKNPKNWYQLDPTREKRGRARRS